MLPIFTRAALLYGALTAISCAAVLGIEDAELDPLSGAGGDAGEPGAGGDGGSGAGEDSGAADTGAPRTLCERYCDTVLQNCTGGLTQWESPAHCLEACGAFEPGTPGDETGNTAECRLFYAELAEISEPDVHCRIAGPGGDGVCGTNCEGYCTLMDALCEGEFDPATTCAPACEELDDIGDFHIGITSGNHVQCRLYHVSAATQSATVHCPHAGGADPCDP